MKLQRNSSWGDPTIVYAKLKGGTSELRLFYGGYGHNPSGKQYVYWGPDNYRTGQEVLAPVTGINGRTYNTMFTIMRTSGEDSEMAQREASRLESAGIDIKSLGGRDVLSLPSGSLYESKAQWARASERKYQARVNLRVNHGVNISRTANPTTFLRRFR